MNSKNIISSLFALAIVTFIYGFFSEHESTIAPYETNTGWGANCNFVTQVTQSKSGPKKQMMAHIHPYKLLAVDRRNLLIRPQDSDAQIIHSHWVKADKEWVKVYRVSITRGQLQAVQFVEDLVPNYPIEWLSSYEHTSVWIKSNTNPKGISLMSTGRLLDEKQRQLLDQMDLGGHFEMVINYEKIEGPTGKEKYKRMNLEFTVVPEISAQYPAGSDALVAYFESNLNDVVIPEEIQQFSTLVLKFTIAINGNATDIHVTHRSNFEEMDKKVIDLTEKMPTWIPARNAKGERVEQTFELIYGMPGC